MHASEDKNDESGPDIHPRRRGFLAFGVGAIVSVLAVIPGIGVVLDPLFRKKKSGGTFIRITSLDAVPADGLPHRFQVIAGRIDKWNKYDPEPIDAVYVIRSRPDVPPIVFSVICPHLGCAFDFKPSADEFQCPCHTSGFALNGEVKYGPSPRALDELTVETRMDGEVIKLAEGQDVPEGVELWIDYKKFKVGKAKKLEV